MCKNNPFHYGTYVMQHFIVATAVVVVVFSFSLLFMVEKAPLLQLSWVYGPFECYNLAVCAY